MKKKLFSLVLLSIFSTSIVGAQQMGPGSGMGGGQIMGPGGMQGGGPMMGGGPGGHGGMPGGGPGMFVESQLKQLQNIKNKAAKAGYTDIAKILTEGMENAEALAELMDGEEGGYEEGGLGIEPDSDAMAEVEQDMKNTVAALESVKNVQGATKKATTQRRSLVNSALKILNRLLSMMGEGKEMMAIGKQMEQKMTTLSEQRRKKDKERMLLESAKMEERFTKEEAQRAEWDIKKEEMEKQRREKESQRREKMMRGQGMQDGMYGGIQQGMQGQMPNGTQNEGGMFGGQYRDMNSFRPDMMNQWGTQGDQGGFNIQQSPPPPTSGNLFDIFVSWLYNVR